MSLRPGWPGGATAPEGPRLPGAPSWTPTASTVAALVATGLDATVSQGWGRDVVLPAVHLCSGYAGMELSPCENRPYRGSR